MPFDRESLLLLVSSLHWTDYVDICLVAGLIYGFLRFLAGTRAASLIKGLLLLLVLWFATEKLSLYSLKAVLEGFMAVGLIAIVILFQPELRRILEHLGRVGFLRAAMPAGQVFQLVDELLSALARLSRSQTGALIVIERNTGLRDLGEARIRLDSLISAELLMTIFHKLTPLHDGAVILSNGRIESASCFLPLSQSRDLPPELGSRHRAAVGISELSDCIALVVSEETGRISWVQGGEVEQELSEDIMRERLLQSFQPPDGVSLQLKGLREAVRG